MIKVPFALALLLLTNPALADQSAAVGTTDAPVTTAEVGKVAPAFELVSAAGEKVTLKSLRGKTVVLEWFNPDCPFVKLAHGKGPMKKIAKAHLDAGGVWLAINSGSSGMQGHGKERNLKAAKDYQLIYPILLDETGQVGKAYRAARTPQIFVIDGQGILRYAGALDSTRGGGYDENYTNYTAEALKAVSEGKTVETASTKAWGCSVKYGN